MWLLWRSKWCFDWNVTVFFCRRVTRLQKITHIQYSLFSFDFIDCHFWMFVSTLKWSHPRSSISTHFFLNRHDFSEIIIVRVYVMISRVTYIYICIILLLAYPLNVLRSQKTAQFGLALGITGVTGGVFEGHGYWEAMQPLSCESCVFFPRKPLRIGCLLGNAGNLLRIGSTNRLLTK